MSEPDISTEQSEGKAQADKQPSWSVAAALVITLFNGGIAFFGWNSAKDISEHEEAAKNKLAAIQQVVERSYILYARALERELTEIIANTPGVELTGTSVEQAKSSVMEDKRNLEVLEKEIPQEKHQSTKYLIDGFFYLSEDCKKAIESLNQYSKEVPAKYLLLATAHHRCNNNQKSIEFNNKVKDLPMTRPGERIRAKAESNLGNSYIRNDQPQDAISSFKSALRIDPSLYGVNYNLAIAYVKLGKHNDAIKALCRYKSSHDGNVITEVETDPDKDFQGLIHWLGTDWRKKLNEKLNNC